VKVRGSATVSNNDVKSAPQQLLYTKQCDGLGMEISQNRFVCKLRAAVMSAVCPVMAAGILISAPPDLE